MMPSSRRIDTMRDIDHREYAMPSYLLKPPSRRAMILRTVVHTLLGAVVLAAALTAVILALYSAGHALLAPQLFAPSPLSGGTLALIVPLAALGAVIAIVLARVARLPRWGQVRVALQQQAGHGWEDVDHPWVDVDHNADPVTVSGAILSNWLSGLDGGAQPKPNQLRLTLTYSDGSVVLINGADAVMRAVSVAVEVQS
ncbi:hypothetical protein AB0I55_29285 [Actinocatenispora sera]|uniref:hypothetical protein n=1 Tax=Actinocatenispora sera TaxID=390989 RepID=UPI003408260A